MACHDGAIVAAHVRAIRPGRHTTWARMCTSQTCGTAKKCCSTGCSPSTSRRCCRSSTLRRSGRRSSGSVTSSAAPRGGPVDGPPDDVEVAFRNYGMGAEDVDLIVATDVEGILGIGDWDVGGIEIPSLLTVAGSS